jgi:hypothetical protein
MERIIIRSLKSLKKQSYVIEGPIEVYVPQEDCYKVGVFNPTYDLEEIVHCYRIIDHVICFIEGDKMYAIPACNKVKKILDANHFHEDFSMRVPFIFGSYPVHNTERWSALLHWQCHRMNIEAGEGRSHKRSTMKV